MKPHLEVPREGEACLPLGGAELWLWDAPWVWGLAPTHFVPCWEAPSPTAVLWSQWCGLSGLGRDLLRFLSCFLWTHRTFSHCGAAPADQTCCVEQCWGNALGLMPSQWRELSSFPQEDRSSVWIFTQAELPGRALVRQWSWACSVSAGLCTDTGVLGLVDSLTGSLSSYSDHLWSCLVASWFCGWQCKL